MSDKPTDDADEDLLGLGIGEEEEEDLLAMGAEDLEGLGDGLELDDRQAQEIKDIFLVTLPQYLEPVAEMMDQLFSGEGDEPDPEVRQALCATLSSLSSAASRIGLGSIFERLDHMGELIGELGGPDWPRPAEIQEDVYRDFAEIRAMTGDSSALEPPTTDKGQTLVSAIRGMEGIDEGALSRLTAAGLVTIDQLLMAEPDEIMAVSGLGAEVVRRILSGLGKPESPPATQGAEGAKVLELQLGEGPLRAQLEKKHRAQVEAEAGLDEIRAEVDRLQSRGVDLRRQLSEAELECENLRQALSRSDRNIRQLSARLGERRSSREEVLRRRDDAAQEVAAQEKRILELRGERQQAVADQDQFGQKIATLEERIARILEISRRG